MDSPVIEKAPYIIGQIKMATIFSTYYLDWLTSLTYYESQYGVQITFSISVLV